MLARRLAASGMIALGRTLRQAEEHLERLAGKLGTSRPQVAGSLGYDHCSCPTSQVSEACELKDS